MRAIHHTPQPPPTRFQRVWFFPGVDLNRCRVCYACMRRPRLPGAAHDAGQAMHACAPPPPARAKATKIRSHGNMLYDPTGGPSLLSPPVDESTGSTHPNPLKQVSRHRINRPPTHQLASCVMMPTICATWSSQVWQLALRASARSACCARMRRFALRGRRKFGNLRYDATICATWSSQVWQLALRWSVQDWDLVRGCDDLRCVVGASLATCATLVGASLATCATLLWWGLVAGRTVMYH